jgi:hypothetical protein
MRLVKSALQFLFLSCVFALVAGCGETDPNANVPPEKIAPDPTKLGEDPEYAKQFGGAKK